MNGDVCVDESLSRPKPSRFLLLFRGKGCRIVRWGSAPTIWQVSLRAKTDPPPLRSGQSPSAEVITRHLRDMARACASFNRWFAPPVLRLPRLASGALLCTYYVLLLWRNLERPVTATPTFVSKLCYRMAFRILSVVLLSGLSTLRGVPWYFYS